MAKDLNLNIDILHSGCSIPIEDTLTVDCHGDLVDLLHYIPIEAVMNIPKSSVCCKARCTLCPSDSRISTIRDNLLSAIPCSTKSISSHGFVLDLAEFFPCKMLNEVKNLWSPICPSSCNRCPVSSHPSWIRKFLTIKEAHSLSGNTNYLNQELRKPESPDEDIDLHGIIYNLKCFFPEDLIPQVKEKWLPLCILECGTCPKSSYLSHIKQQMRNQNQYPVHPMQSPSTPCILGEENDGLEKPELVWLNLGDKPMINYFYQKYFYPNPIANPKPLANGKILPIIPPASPSPASYAAVVKSAVMPPNQSLPTQKPSRQHQHLSTSLWNLPFHPRNRPNNSKKPRCYKCGELGHVRIKCRDPKICYRCGLFSHSARNCPLIRGPPQSIALASKSNPNPANIYSKGHNPISSFPPSLNPPQQTRNSPKMSVSSPSISTSLPLSFDMAQSLNYYQTWAFAKTNVETSPAYLQSALPAICPHHPNWTWHVQKINNRLFRVRFPSTHALTRALLPRTHEFNGLRMTFKVWMQHSGAITPSFTATRWFKIWGVPDFIWSRSDIQKLVVCLGVVEEYPLLRFPPAPQPYRRICIRPFNLSPFPTSLYLHVSDQTYWCPIEIELEATLMGSLPPDVMVEPNQAGDDFFLQLPCDLIPRPQNPASTLLPPNPPRKEGTNPGPSAKISSSKTDFRSLIAQFGPDPRSGILGAAPARPEPSTLKPTRQKLAFIRHWKARRIRREEETDLDSHSAEDSISTLEARNISFSPPVASGISPPSLSIHLNPDQTVVSGPLETPVVSEVACQVDSSPHQPWDKPIESSLAVLRAPDSLSSEPLSVNSSQPIALQMLPPSESSTLPIVNSQKSTWTPELPQLLDPLTLSEWHNPTLANLRDSIKSKIKLKKDFDDIWNGKSKRRKQKIKDLGGLGANKKLYKIRDRLATLKPEILCLQETKLQSLDSFRFKKFSPPFLDQWANIDAIGSSGGLITCWDSRLFDIISVMHGVFSLTIKLVDRRSSLEWSLTNVYGPCISASKGSFWSELSQLGSSLSSSRWILGGDFNSTISSDDRNIAPSSSKISKPFLSFLNKFNLVDIPLQGWKFTWSNLQVNPTLVKLDRFLISLPGWDTYPLAYCSGHPRFLSDHIPLEFSSDRGKEPRKPFKLNPSLIGLPDLDSSIRRTWSSSSSLHFHLRIRQLKKEYKKYSKTNFKPIHLEKIRVSAFIQDLDLKEEASGTLSPCSFKARALAKSHLANILDSEEQIWKIRSKARWVKNGDCNTSYYHRLASYRKKLNYISRLTIHNSELTTPALIHNSLRIHFMKLFSAPPASLAPIIDWNLLQCPKLLPQQVQALESPFTLTEIRKAIWALPEDKSPGPDGFPIKFFKHFWETLKLDILKILTDFQSGLLDLTPINISFLTLIPKREGASDIKEFRPISLQNTITKIISKILAERLKPVLNNLIAGGQSAYLNGRSLAESFAVAQEVIHSARISGFKGVLLKLDFSKAFDCLRWDFLLQCLQERGFGPLWISWISNLLHTSSISVLLNGIPSKPFPIHRGLRQGDPLSAYLFITVADSLSRLLSRAQTSNLISGIPINPSRPNVLSLSHLQYADDTIIFSSCHPSSILMIKAILHFFGLLSGLSLNLNKTFLIGLNLVDSESISLASLFGCKSSSFPISYLGLPLKDSRLLRNDWTLLSSKISSCLSSWKAQPLSISGRVILINSVVSALPVHFMSLFSLPCWLISEIDKIRKNFLWSGHPSFPKKIHSVGWNEVCKPLHEGGLGIKNLRNFNISLLLKWWWKLMFIPSLWSSIINCKYYWKKLPLDLNINPSKASPTWRSVLKVGKIFTASISWTLGNGKSPSFWIDKWGPSLSLKKEFPNLFSCALEPLNKVFRNYNRRTHTWTPKFHLPLSLDSSLELPKLIQLLSSFSISSLPDSPNCSWSLGILSPKTSYEIINLSGIRWKHHDIWSLAAPPRMKFFLWLTLKGKINTKDILLRRGMQLPDLSCVFCSQPETINHLFFLCSQIRPLWDSLCLLPSWVPEPLELADLWGSWRNDLPALSIGPRDLKALALMWAIWSERNKRIFLNNPADARSLPSSAIEVLSSWAPRSR